MSAMMTWMLRLPAVDVATLVRMIEISDEDDDDCIDVVVDEDDNDAVY